ncbi:hypothetical protein VTK26DRAFT_6106 [Humicola hyalothermophila]
MVDYQELSSCSEKLIGRSECPPSALYYWPITAWECSRGADQTPPLVSRYGSVQLPGTDKQTRFPQSPLSQKLSWDHSHSNLPPANEESNLSTRAQLVGPRPGSPEY